ncbi:MAG TPA: GntR family transcriptional regulator [Alphaproteobacteria bacterium]|nr:GntR family transcriptional regulator [Alphaproteobacteria bacterium]
MLETLKLETKGVPIYVQIRDQILAAVGAGTLRPGERLPTMREVSVALKVDLNTVRHAYEAAQEAGAIVMVRAQGTYVTQQPPVPPAEELDRFARQTIAAAGSAGIDPAALGLRITEIAGGKSS